MSGTNKKSNVQNFTAHFFLQWHPVKSLSKILSHYNLIFWLKLQYPVKFCSKISSKNNTIKCNKLAVFADLLLAMTEQWTNFKYITKLFILVHNNWTNFSHLNSIILSNTTVTMSLSIRSLWLILSSDIHNLLLLEVVCIDAQNCTKTYVSDTDYTRILFSHFSSAIFDGEFILRSYTLLI